VLPNGITPYPTPFLSPGDSTTSVDQPLSNLSVSTLRNLSIVILGPKKLAFQPPRPNIKRFLTVKVGIPAEN